MKNKLSINIGVIDSSVKTCVMKSLVAFFTFFTSKFPSLGIYL